MSLKEKRDALRYGVVLQSVAAPSLFEIGRGIMAPTTPAVAAAARQVAKQATVIDPRGRVVKPTKTEAAARP